MVIAAPLAGILADAWGIEPTFLATQHSGMRFLACMACSTRPRTEPLLQTIATVGQFAILGEGVSPGGARGA
jgi:predicted MFS family arabinose efflux permease